MFRIYKNANFKELIKKEGITLPQQINLSLTLKCNWRCIFCYKRCPRPVEFDPDDLLAMVRALPWQGFTFGLSGGEPTLYPYWRNLLKLYCGDPKFGLVTNASGIKLKTDEDIQLLLLSIRSFKVSIHGIGKGAVKVAGSKVQRGLAFLQKTLDVWSGVSESVEKQSGFEHKFTVNIAVLEENLSEIPQLVEKLAQLHDEYGKPDLISVFRPAVVGRMQEHKESIVEFGKFVELCRELRSQYSDLCFEFDAQGDVPPLFFDCIEVEPDGYVYSDLHRVRLGSWKKHWVHEIVRFAYAYGLKLIEQYRGADEVIELPDFTPIYERDFIYQLKTGDVKTYKTQDGVILCDPFTRQAFVLKGVFSTIFYLFTTAPFSEAVKMIEPLKLEQIKPVVDTLERCGLLERREIQVLKGFKLEEAGEVMKP